MKTVNLGRLIQVAILLFSLCLSTLVTASDEDQTRTVYDFETDFGGIAYNYSNAALQYNTQIFSDILEYNASYSSLFFADKTFHFYPGVYGTEITDFELIINGTLRFHRPNKTILNHWGDRPEPCIFIEDSTDILVTSPDPSAAADDFDDDYIDTDYGSTKRGIIDGAGSEYWGIPFIGYLELVEFRPDLFVMNRTSNVMIEYMIFRDPGLYTMCLVDVDHLEIQYSSIVARRTHDDGHSLLDLSAFNTDGIDVAGNDVYIHDVDIWNQDDCIAVKDSFIGESTNMLFERITASGLGLTVGSIGGTTVSNITFRDSLLYKTYKGIYMKFRHDTKRDTPGLVENVLFENITIFEPEQWGIWIGPAQQSINGNPCYANPCSLCWPTIPFTSCNAIVESQFRNITLRDIYIYHPLGSPGVILADESNPIEDITFDNVVVSNEIPSYLKNVDRLQIFAGLKEPIQDTFMHPVKIWLYVSGFCIVIVGLVWLFGFVIIRLVLGKSNTRESAVSQKPLLQQVDVVKAGGFLAHKKTTVLIVAAVVVAAAVQKNLKISEETYNVRNYFVCEGVVNGVATGNTWPVPSCFTDETDQSTS